jgi:hypothetical protein
MDVNGLIRLPAAATRGGTLPMLPTLNRFAASAGVFDAGLATLWWCSVRDAFSGPGHTREEADFGHNRRFRHRGSLSLQQICFARISRRLIHLR